MHYCCVVITKDFPNDDVIEKVLRPFNSEDLYEKPEDNRVYPPFTWDWYEVGGRYGGYIKLKIDKDDEKYKWRYIINEPRNGRLFRSALLDALAHYRKRTWDIAYRESYDFDYMGFSDGFLYVDAALADDIQNISELDCYCFIDQNGNAFSRESYTGETWAKNEEFDKQFSSAKGNSSGCYICVVDLHD